jgi:hypothetical protein
MGDLVARAKYLEERERKRERLGQSSDGKLGGRQSFGLVGGWEGNFEIEMVARAGLPRGNCCSGWPGGLPGDEQEVFEGGEQGCEWSVRTAGGAHAELDLFVEAPVAGVWRQVSGIYDRNRRCPRGIVPVRREGSASGVPRAALRLFMGVGGDRNKERPGTIYGGNGKAWWNRY